MGSNQKSRNRKQNQTKNRRPSGRGASQSTRTQSEVSAKYAKYAGAVSNKSRRNYADLRLVRPSELSDRAGAPEPPRSTLQSAPVHKTGVSGQKEKAGQVSPPRKAPRKGEGKAPSASPDRPSPKAAASGAPKKDRKTTARAGETVGRAAAQLGAWANQTVKSVSSRAAEASATRKKTSRPSAAPKKQRAVQEDDYTRALNNEDFYGDLVEKYYLKYPEEQETRKSPPGSAAARSKKSSRAVRPSPVEAVKRLTQTASRPSAPAGEKQQSIAALAANHRKAPRGKQFAGKLLHGKAKGSVPVGAVHRKVRRTNRRRSLFLYGASAASVAAVLGFLFFFWGFKVKRIVVAGETPYSAERITGLCTFSKGDNLMFIDTAVSQQQVVDALPYVEQCEIRRAIPNSVEVRVTGANRLGVAETGSGLWAIVSTSGRILERITNVALISDSDLGMTYEPDVRTVDDVAQARQLPVLTGLAFDKDVVGGSVDKESAAYVKVFDIILRKAADWNMSFTRLRHTDRGYEADLEGRLNLVLGETDNEDILGKRLHVADEIIYVRKEIGEHEKGELTYLKNQVFFNPSYDYSEEELERYEQKHAKDGEIVPKLGAALLDKGVEVFQKAGALTREPPDDEPEDNG